jgi:outer membrane protein TolC
MKKAFWRLPALACAFLLAAVGARAQAGGDSYERIQQMLRIVLENNPTLASQAALLRDSEKLPQLRGGVALTGLSFSFATSVWDPDAGSYRFYPAATVGTSISIADPARALNSYNLKKAREEARQQYMKTRNELVADLLATVRELVKLAARRQSLEKLKAYLQDYSDLIEKQVRAGVATPELDKMWELKERLLGIEADIEDAGNMLGTIGLEAALRLGGDSWEGLLELLKALGG